MTNANWITHRGKGFSLVELMVAMTIGLFIVGVLGTVYLTGRMAYRTQDSGSRLQESIRYAFEVVSHEVRMAGYTGCGGLHDVTPKSIACGTGGCPPKIGLEGGSFRALIVYALDSSGNGWTGKPTGITPLKGTHVIQMQRLDECGASLVGNYDAINANVQVANATSCNFKDGDVLAITNCSKTNIFRAENVSSGGGKITIAHSKGKGYNDQTKLPDTFGPDAQIAKFKQVAFYVKLNASAVPSLYQVDLSCLKIGKTLPECETELVEDIYDIQTTVGVDSDANGQLNSYVAPGLVTDWGTASSLVVTLSARSKDNGIATTTSAAYAYDGANVSDRRLKQSFSSAIGIRNMLP